MPQDNRHSCSRRRFLKSTGVAALAAGAGPAVIIPGRAQPKTLKILRTRGGAPAVNSWFVEVATTWGTRNGVEVIVDHIGSGDVRAQIAAEAAAQHGHDIIVHWEPLAIYEDQAIDHAELYQEAERRYGKAAEIAVKSTYNRKTGKYHGVCDVYGINFTHYRQDLWQAVDRHPDTWEDVLQGGRHIKLLHERPVGIALQPNVDSETSWRGLLYSFGGSVQDADNRPALKSSATRAALGFGKALFEQAMTNEVLAWGPYGNSRAMLAGDISLTINSNSIIRADKKKQFPATDNIWLAATPQGPLGRFAPLQFVNVFMVWKFGQNIETAKQFVVDIIGQTRDRLLKSDLIPLPAFPGSVPDYVQLITDNNADPSIEYQMLTNVDDWSTQLGYPGTPNPAVAEIYNTGLIPNMFAAVATGKMTPEEAMAQADQEVRQIYDKWRTLGKV